MNMLTFPSLNLWSSNLVGFHIQKGRSPFSLENITEKTVRCKAVRQLQKTSLQVFQQLVACGPFFSCVKQIMNVWNNIWTSNTAIGNFMKNHDIHMTTNDGRWPSTIRASQSGGAMARFDRQFEESLFSDDWWTLWWIMKTRWVVSAGLVEFLFSGDICFFDLKLTNVLNQVSSKRWLRDVHLGVMYEKDTPKWWNGNLTERLGQKAKIEPEVWTFPTPFMLPFWLPFCVGGITASKSRKRVVPAHVEQNEMMFLHPVAKPTVGVFSLGSLCFAVAQKFTVLRMAPSALVPSHLIRNAAAYSFTMSHEHHSKPFAAAPFPFGGSAFGSGAWRRNPKQICKSYAFAANL